MPTPIVVTVGGRTLLARTLSLGALKRGVAEKLDKGKALFTAAGASDLIAIIVEGFTSDKGEALTPEWVEDNVPISRAEEMVLAVLEASSIKAAPGEAPSP